MEEVVNVRREEWGLWGCRRVLCVETSSRGPSGRSHAAATYRAAQDLGQRAPETDARARRQSQTPEPDARARRQKHRTPADSDKARCDLVTDATNKAAVREAAQGQCAASPSATRESATTTFVISRRQNYCLLAAIFAALTTQDAGPRPQPSPHVTSSSHCPAGF
ncbi:hypothetical protein P154DRAFT_580164 [Amniculicola lignicola CBS 123094]|uniref:Uncharacterized protein n=1 Tax=Amniculicola lignicola CBS 123094 TaxID=1392246 RepID=A0A6A5W5G4_9PLEO|nr:hypothetical protein P154DRAFT_580164 [Amniculicola lignicola CBS 123094]